MCKKYIVRLTTKERQTLREIVKNAEGFEPEGASRSNAVEGGCGRSCVD